MSTTVDDSMLAVSDGRTKFSISRARDSLPALVNLVSEQPNVMVELDRREQPQAFLVSTKAASLLTALFDNRFEEVLLNMAVRHWLGADAPEHITAPQLKELDGLSIKQCVALIEADPDRLSADDEQHLKIPEKQLQRLKKRRQISLVIAQAKRDDLYEVNEHHTQISGI
jgi:hypothetical protein